jgi:hypothetical protein
MGKRREFDDDEAHWYALDVMRQKEYVAAYLLQRRFGCMTFVPTQTRFRKRSRYVKSAQSKIEVAYPAVPGVVFCGFPAAPEWFHVMGMHLVNGVLSMDGRPHRIETASREWIDYRAHQLDGSMTIERQVFLYGGGEVERSVKLIQIQGRGVIRSPLSIKARAGGDRPLVVIRAAGERARQLGAILGGKQPEEIVLAAA